MGQAFDEFGLEVPRVFTDWNNWRLDGEAVESFGSTDRFLHD